MNGLPGPMNGLPGRMNGFAGPMAGQLYGIGGQVQTTIAEAWSAVGLPVPPGLMKRAEVVPIRRPRPRAELPEKKAA